MTDQGTLDFEGKTYVRREGPDTSREAARDAGVIRRAKSDEGEIYRLLLGAAPKGLTNDDLAAILGSDGRHRIIPPNQVASRTKTLRDRGLAKWTDEYRTTRRGKRARVQVAIHPADPDLLK